MQDVLAKVWKELRQKQVGGSGSAGRVEGPAPPINVSADQSSGPALVPILTDCAIGAWRCPRGYEVDNRIKRGLASTDTLGHLKKFPQERHGRGESTKGVVQEGVGGKGTVTCWSQGPMDPRR